MAKTIHDSCLALVKMLNGGGCYDGNTIGDALQISRSAVWKLIHKLMDYGVPITSIKGKGYTLQQPLILLEAQKIAPYFADQPIDIQVFESIDSTNDYLKNSKKSSQINCCLAERQTQGKGRLSRVWYSPFGQNIYLSCLYPFQLDISALAGLSLVTSLAIVAALKQVVPQDDLQVKWPNDIVYHGRKLAGSLIEIQAESNGISYAVVGIGVNVNMLQDAKAITQPWASLRQISGEYIDRNSVVVCLLQQLLHYFQTFSRHGFPVFIEEWKRNDCLMEQCVALNQINKTIHGKMTGINAYGHLLVTLPDGTVRAFSSGDTAIVKNRR